MSELTKDSALEFLADYITNNKINYVGGEFEREDNNERFLLVVSKESALKNLTEEADRLRSERDEFAFALKCLVSEIHDKSLAYAYIESVVFSTEMEFSEKLLAKIKGADNA